MDGDGSDGSGDSGSDYSFGDSGGSFGREDLGIILVILAIIVAVVSGLFSIFELRYAIWGKIVPAEVRELKVVRINQGQGQHSEALAVTYLFSVDGGEAEVGSDALPEGWPRPGRTIDVQYVSGRRMHSRVAGHESKLSYSIFLGSLAVLAGVLFKFYLEAKSAERRPQPRRR